MRVGVGLDQLGADADLVARSPDAAFQHIAHSKLAADLLCLGGPVPIGERGVARNDEHVREPRQIGRQVLGDSIGKILLFSIVTQIRKGQNYDRQARWRYWSGELRARCR